MIRIFLTEAFNPSAPEFEGNRNNIAIAAPPSFFQPKVPLGPSTSIPSDGGELLEDPYSGVPKGNDLGPEDTSPSLTDADYSDIYDIINNPGEFVGRFNYHVVFMLILNEK